MRVWLYGRLSNDDDVMMNSLENQLEIVREYARKHGHQIIGESYDDNVSGMRFDRKGLNQITQAADTGKIDAVIVKDLSRLGRHQLQTALFIDYLRSSGVAVISVTEGLNTLDDEHDLIIGVRQIMNDFYAKDIGNKIRHGYREKQKEGLVITPPFGYWKDRNTNCVYQHPEAAETVRLIFDLYLQGCGQKDIARRLNRMGRKTPAQLRAERYGEEFYSARKSKTGQFVWSYVSVKNVLVEEGYTGVLINHRTETNCGKAKRIAHDGWIRHEGFYPAIITKEEWAQVQALLKQNARPANGNQAAHRYAGLLICGDCGNPFVPMIRYWNGNRRVEYVCKGYHGHGKEFCSSHRIHEECLDAQVMEYAHSLRAYWLAEQAELRRLQKLLFLRQPMITAQIEELREEIRQDEEDIDELLMLKIHRGKKYPFVADSECADEPWVVRNFSVRKYAHFPGSRTERKSQITGGFMKTGLTRKQKVTEFYFNEHDDLAEIYTHNTDLKKRLLAYAQQYPELCQLTEDDEQGGLRFEIDKHRIGVRLTAPYSPERRAASSQRAKEGGIAARNKAQS